MQRRVLLGLSAGFAALVLAGYRPSPFASGKARDRPVGARLADLNPDRMWPVYRRYHLLIVFQRDDETGGGCAAAVADVLARFLPSSRAQTVRAADARRVGVLLATDQQDIAIMAEADADALFLGKEPFADIGGAPLRAIVSLGSHLLVCRPDFRARHAYLIAKALAEHDNALPARVSSAHGIVAAHPGARAYFAGEEMPDD